MQVLLQQLPQQHQAQPPEAHSADPQPTPGMRATHQPPGQKSKKRMPAAQLATQLAALQPTHQPPHQPPRQLAVRAGKGKAARGRSSGPSRALKGAHPAESPSLKVGKAVDQRKAAIAHVQWSPSVSKQPAKKPAKQPAGNAAQQPAEKPGWQLTMPPAGLSDQTAADIALGAAARESSQIPTAPPSQPAMLHGGPSNEREATIAPGAAASQRRSTSSPTPPSHPIQPGPVASGSPTTKDGLSVVAAQADSSKLQP